jgi:hypothetical protein
MSTTAALQLTRDFEHTTCRDCGVEYWLPALFLEYRREKGGTWYCPNGHSWSFTETEVARLKKLVEAKEREVNWQRQLCVKADKEREKVERKLHRVQKGVCPHCNRSFGNLQRHMESKHGPERKAT